MRKALTLLLGFLILPAGCQPGSDAAPILEESTPTPEIFIARTQGILGGPRILEGVGLQVAGAVVTESFPPGYLLSFVMLMLPAAVGVGVVAQTLVQLRLGICDNTGQLIGSIGSWFVLGMIALGFSVSMLRNLSE